MAQLIPVERDPFAASARKLIPVERDPFASRKFEQTERVRFVEENEPPDPLERDYEDVPPPVPKLRRLGSDIAISDVDLTQPLRRGGTDGGAGGAPKQTQYPWQAVPRSVQDTVTITRPEGQEHMADNAIELQKVGNVSGLALDTPARLVQSFGVTLPGMAGNAMEWFGIAPETGNAMSEWSEEVKKHWKLPDTYGSSVADAFAIGMDMIGPSAGPSLIAHSLGRILTGAKRAQELSAKAAAAGRFDDAARYLKDAQSGFNVVNKGSALFTAGLFSGSQAQETLDAAQKIGVAPGAAPYIAGLIEGTGEYFGTKYLGKALGLDGKGGIIGPAGFARLLGVELTTEFGQTAGVSAVEKGYGIRPHADPLKEGAATLGPTAAMTLMLGGLGKVLRLRAEKPEPKINYGAADDFASAAKKPTLSEAQEGTISTEAIPQAGPAPITLIPVEHNPLQTIEELGPINQGVVAQLPVKQAAGEELGPINQGVVAQLPVKQAAGEELGPINQGVVAQRPAPPPAMTYKEFKSKYELLFKLMMEYSPKQVGAGIYAKQMAELSDKYPAFAEAAESEFEAKAPVKPSSPVAGPATIEQPIEKPVLSDKEYAGRAKRSAELVQRGMANRVPSKIAIESYVAQHGGSFAGADITLQRISDAEYAVYAGVAPDPAEVQRINNSIAEGEMILKSGLSISGKKMSQSQLGAVRRAVENARAKIGAPSLFAGDSPAGVSKSKKTKEPARPNLVQFLIRRGGISARLEEGGGLIGELRYLGEFLPRPIYNQLVRKKKTANAVSFDNAREAAIEAGYLPEDATLDDLLDALMQSKEHPLTVEDKTQALLETHGYIGKDRRIATEEGRKRIKELLDEVTWERQEMHDALVAAGIRPDTEHYTSIMKASRVDERAIDDVTGWLVGKYERPAMEGAAFDYHEGDRNSSIAIIDLRNLSGLNDAVGNNTAIADRHIRAVADIIKASVENTGNVAQFFRSHTRGDELSVLMRGDAASLSRAMELAAAKTATYVEAEGFADIPSPKGKAPGFGFYSGVADFQTYYELEEVLDAASVILDKQKKLKEEKHANRGELSTKVWGEHEGFAGSDREVLEKSGNTRGGTRQDDSGGAASDVRSGDNAGGVGEAETAEAGGKRAVAVHAETDSGAEGKRGDTTGKGFKLEPPKAAESRRKPQAMDMFGAKEGLEGTIRAKGADLEGDSLFTRDELVAHEKARREAAARQGSLVDDSPFKRGESVSAPLDAKELDAVIKRVAVNWKGGADNVVVVDTFDALPAKVRQEAQKQGAKPNEIPGAFHHGKVYLVRSNIASAAEAEAAIFHEAYGHAGLRGVLGQEVVDKLNKLYHAIGPKTMRNMAEKKGIPLDLYEEGFRQAGYSLRIRRAALTEEMLSFLQQEHSQGGIAVKVKEVIGAVRNWMRENGFMRLAKFNDADIAYLLRQAREYTRSDGRFAGKGTAFMTAWHGTPHDFDKFKTEKIGTGEGHQAYGAGLYFASARSVAEWYRDGLRRGTVSVNGNPITYQTYDDINIKYALGKLFDGNFQSIDEAIQKARSLVTEMTLSGGATKTDAYRDANRVLDGLKTLKKLGAEYKQHSRLYQVELAPAKDEYLLWDAPLSEQSEKVKAILADILPADEDMAGKDIYKHLSEQMADDGSGNEDMLPFARQYAPKQAASGYLHSLGIRGIKYLDSMSRNVAAEHNENIEHNYVIFHDDDISITAKFMRKPDGQDAIRSIAIPKDAATIISSHSDIAAVKAHPAYTAAKSGDAEAAVRLVSDMVKPETVDSLRNQVGSGAIFVAPHAMELTGKNKIPIALATRYAEALNGSIDRDIVQSNQVYHTGADAMERIIAPVHFDGPVVKGGRYVLVDDATTMGSTLADLGSYIQQRGGTVVGAVTLTNAGRADKLNASLLQIRTIERRFGDELRNSFGKDPAALTAAEAGYLIGFKDAQSLRNRAFAARQETGRRLRAKSVRASAPEAVTPTTPSTKTSDSTSPGGTSGHASTGGYARTGALENIAIPELVEMAKTLLGSIPSIMPRLRLMRGTALGAFSAKMRTGTITLHASMFKDDSIAAGVLAHEIGHAWDWLPDKTLSRGNILGSIGALQNYMRSLLQQSPASAEAVLTPKERSRMRTEAIRTVLNHRGLKMSEYMKDKAIRDSLKQDIKDEYQMSLAEEAAKRSLYTRDEMMIELKALSQLWKPFDETVDAKYTKYRYSPRELYADAISVLLNDPALLKQTAPRFHDALFNWIEQKPAVKAVYEDIQNRVKSPETVQQTRLDNLREGFRQHNEAREQQVQKMMQADKSVLKDVMRTLKHGLVNELDDTYAALNKVALETPSLKDTIEKTKNDISSLAYVDSEVSAFLYDVQERIYKKIDNAGVSKDDIGIYALAMRIAAGDRAGHANPLGHTVKTATEAIMQLHKDLGSAKMSAIDDVIEEYWKLRNEVIIPALEKSGLLSPALEKMVKENKYYFTLSVTEAMQREYGEGSRHVYSPPATIHRQLGTLKEVGNPFIETILKDAALLRAAANNAVKLDMLDMMNKGKDSPFVPADKRWVNKRNEYISKETDDIGTLYVLRSGKMEAWYGPREIVDDFRHTPAKARALVRLWQMFNQPLRELLVRRNPGWMLMNLPRDFRGSLENVDGMDVPTLLYYYAKAARHAWGDAVKNSRTDLVQEMMRSREIAPERIFASSEITPEDALERMMAEFGMHDTMTPAKHRALVMKPLWMIWDGVEKAGTFTERWAKIAVHMYLAERTNLPAHAIAKIVRERAGTPDYRRRGAWHVITNNLFLFSNVNKEGLRASVNAAKENPKTWWWKQLKYTMLPKFIMYAGLLGLLGDDLERMYRKVSHFNMLNYIIVPFGEDENGKVMSIRIPLSFSGQTLSSMLWNVLTGKVMGRRGLLDSLKEAQPYRPAPQWGVLDAWLDYAKGQNPSDDFTGQRVVHDQKFEAKDWRATQDMVGWSWNKLGGQLLYRYRSDDLKKTQSDLEAFTRVPPGTWLRFLSVENTGERQALKDTIEPVRTEEARRLLDVRERIVELSNKAVDDNRRVTGGEVVQLYRELQGEGMLRPDMRISEFRSMVYRYADRSMNNPAIDAVQNAQSLREKRALLNEYRRTMPEHEYQAIYRQLVREGAITGGIAKDAARESVQQQRKALNQ